MMMPGCKAAAQRNWCERQIPTDNPALNLLAQAAEDRPLLCIVDDVQWLDQATAQVLGFVGRRLLAEPVGLVFAARTTTASEDPLAGLPDLRLSGLDEQSARALLASVTTGRLDESVRRRIVEEAHGNPLALRELGVLDFAGGFAMPDSVSVPRRIEDQYLTRLRGLPRVTQRLLLVAAADPVGDRALLARAAHTLDLDVGALELAVDAGLLDSGAEVRFRHPLLWCGARAGTAGRRRCRRRALPRRHRIVFPHPHGFSPRAGTTVLRRMAAAQHRGTDAATQLRRAFDEFAAMGANAFAQRTRCELEATGEKVRAHREGPGAGLTPQEHQIAQLARTRRTNPEIGAELFLSARTVEWHRLREGHFSFRDRGPSGTRLYVVTVAIPHGVRA